MTYEAQKERKEQRKQADLDRKEQHRIQRDKK